MWNKKGVIFDGHRSQLPVVDQYDLYYRIYCSNRRDNKSIPFFIDVDKSDLSKIIYKSESDFLMLGRKGTFDWAGIMPTDIVTYGAIKYLYYIGWSIRQDVPYHNNLGLAISMDDGKNWEKFSDGPIFHTSHNEPGFIGTVEVLIEDGIWRMWYLSCRDWVNHYGIMEPKYDIKYAESKDGIIWYPHNLVCIPLDSDEGGISSARIIKNKNTYEMWYSVRKEKDYRTNPNNSYRIKKAISSDGLHWTKNKLIELDISEESVWDNSMVCYPFLVENKDNLIMFYNGNNFGETGVGYATKTRT